MWLELVRSFRGRPGLSGCTTLWPATRWLIGRSDGNDSGRSVFVGSPLESGSHDSCGSWPEALVSSGKLGLAEDRHEKSCRLGDGLERLGTERAQRVEAASGEFAGERH
jgi:hypothetical protein